MNRSYRRSCVTTSQISSSWSDVICKVQVIYQTWDAVFHHQMKHREESWKYDAQRSIFDELRTTKSPIYEWEGNWTELTFAKSSGIVTTAYYRCVISSNPRNNCGTYFGSSSLLASKVAKKGNQRTAPDRLVTICSVYNISFTSLYARTRLRNCLGIFQGR